MGIYVLHQSGWGRMDADFLDKNYFKNFWSKSDFSTSFQKISKKLKNVDFDIFDQCVNTIPGVIYLHSFQDTQQICINADSHSIIIIQI